MSVRAFAQEFDINFAAFRNWLYKKQAATRLDRVVGFELLVRFYFFFWLLFISKIFVWELIR